MRHIIPISGKDSLTAALVQMDNDCSLPYELMFNKTGSETPEVYAWLDKVSSRLYMPIAYVGDDLESIIDHWNILPSAKARYCTKLAKIHPMEDWIGNSDATVYYGIRADEQRTGYLNTKKPNIKPAYPLVDASITLSDVWNILEQRDLMPPLFFWQSMYDSVVAKMGDFRSLVDELDRPSFHTLFAGRSRANCYFCFFQRAYEWIWLSETHPDLFWHSVEIEERTGSDAFHWHREKTLRTLFSEAHKIKKHRSDKIVRMLMKQTQHDMFDTDDIETPDLLQVVSCGLFCGK